MQIKDLIPWANHTGDVEKDGDAAQHPLAEFQREMNRMFDTFWKGPGGALEAGGFFGPSALNSDVVETEMSVEVTVELPGMEEKDIDLSLSDGALTVKGEKKIESQEDKTGYHLSERRYGSFQRMIPLPSGIDRDAAQASFKNGVLTVILPKTPEAQTRARKIEVKSG